MVSPDLVKTHANSLPVRNVAFTRPSDPCLSELKTGSSDRSRLKRRSFSSHTATVQRSPRRAVMVASGEP